MATPNYDINYNDKRFTEVEADKKAALSEVDVTYGNMISGADKFYQAQINAAKDYAETQKKNQQEQTDFAIEQIEQQKAQAKQDYTKEQSGAYVDWQKQSGQYGVNAEQMAAQGMQNTGFSESSQVSMFNTYQNRVATARESYNRAVLNYDNAIKDARLQNNAALAEIAYNALQKELELSLQGFQYKNDLIIQKSDKKLEVDNTYHQRYQDVLSQINTENALAEDVRQYEKSFAEDQRQFNKEYELKNKEYEEGIRQFNEEIARLKAQDAKENALEIQKLELQKAQLAEEKRQFNVTQAAKNNSAAIVKSGGGSGGSKSSGSTKAKTTVRNSTVAKNGTDIKGTSSAKSSDKKIDMQSVLNLGYGPISEATLAKKVASGEVVQYTSNGVTKFKKNAKQAAYELKQKQLFSRLG